MVQGVGIWGCGIESQLESWYRFLVQPDPYGSLALDAKATPSGNDVDTTILQQRKDFLRPDSLVAVIVLTDENDSENRRPLARPGRLLLHGHAYPPPSGTAACASKPERHGLPARAASGLDRATRTASNGAYNRTSKTTGVTTSTSATFT